MSTRLYQDDSPFTHCSNCGVAERLHLVWEDEANVFVKCEGCNKMLRGRKQELRGVLVRFGVENEVEATLSYPCLAVAGELDTERPGPSRIEVAGREYGLFEEDPD